MGFGTGPGGGLGLSGVDWARLLGDRWGTGTLCGVMSPDRRVSDGRGARIGWNGHGVIGADFRPDLIAEPAGGSLAPWGSRPPVSKFNSDPDSYCRPGDRPKDGRCRCGASQPVGSPYFAGSLIRRGGAADLYRAASPIFDNSLCTTAIATRTSASSFANNTTEITYPRSTAGPDAKTKCQGRRPSSSGAC